MFKESKKKSDYCMHSQAGAWERERIKPKGLFTPFEQRLLLRSCLLFSLSLRRLRI